MTSARRGRPPKPVQPADPGDLRVECARRVGWLLRVNRLYGPDDGAVVASRFAAAFPGGCFPEPVNRPAITHWEDGARPAGYLVLRRYEELLGLEPYQLVAVADAVYRQTLGGAGAPFLRRRVDPECPRTLDRMEELVERAVGTEILKGSEWDELTCGLLAIPGVLLVPRKNWSRLAERLLAETIIADGAAWLQRAEAMARLLGHPRAELAVIGACADLTADATNQVFIEPLTLLELSPRAEASGVLLRQVRTPVNEHAQRGAWYAVAEKIGRDHFTGSELRTLADSAADLLATDVHHPACRLAAAELIRQCAPPDSGRTAGVLRRACATDRSVRNVLATGRTAAAENAAMVVRRIADHAISRLPRDVLPDDPMLRQLLDEMLFHPQISLRVVAAQLVEASPYRRLVGAALLAELRDRRVLAEPPVAAAVVHALTILGDGDGRPYVEELVLARGVPSMIAEAAAWSIGHMRGTSPPAFWTEVLAWQARPDDRARMPPSQARLSESAARGLVYALGIGREMGHLGWLARHPNTDVSARTAASWWLRIPTHVLASTARQAVTA